MLVPAWNEEASLAAVVESAIILHPDIPVLVVDDCSGDGTAQVAAKAGAMVIRLPIHLGLGGALQTGYKYAFEAGFDYVIRLDGDGQHDPRDIARILQALQESGCQVVIGSRFLAGRKTYTSLPRGVGIALIRVFLWPILGRTISDPTSGFTGVDRRALEVFSRTFPLAYPEIEILVVLQRKRFRFEEVPVKMFPRQAGKSSITAWNCMQYMVHVLLGVFVNVLRINPFPRSGSNDSG